jgi:hypothetical protein
MSHPRLTVLSGHGGGTSPCSTRLVSFATSAAAAHTAKVQPPPRNRVIYPFDRP